jgi:hypothetical protein
MADRGDVQVEVLSERELFAIIRGGQPHDFSRGNFR